MPRAATAASVLMIFTLLSLVDGRDTSGLRGPRNRAGALARHCRLYRSPVSSQSVPRRSL